MEGTSADKATFILNILWSIILDETKRSEDRISAIGTYLTWRDEIDPSPEREFYEQHRQQAEREFYEKMHRVQREDAIGDVERDEFAKSLGYVDPANFRGREEV